MISNDERREVAARLRSLDVHDWNDFMDEVDALETAIGCSIGQDWQDQDWWHRLADLIDRPTCKPVIPNEMEGCVFCHQCGAEIGEYGMPNYCYNCGMEIEK